MPADADLNKCIADESSARQKQSVVRAKECRGKRRESESRRIDSDRAITRHLDRHRGRRKKFRQQPVPQRIPLMPIRAINAALRRVESDGHVPFAGGRCYAALGKRAGI